MLQDTSGASHFWREAEGKKLGWGNWAEGVPEDCMKPGIYRGVLALGVRPKEWFTQSHREGM